jgi:hypothetical protein
MSPAMSPVIALGVTPGLTPLRRLGHEIAHLTGWSVFDGPFGWVLTALLIMALAMVAVALLTGRRREAGSIARAPEPA